MACKIIKTDDALLIEQANLCMERCSAPVDILKRVLSNNLKEVMMNVQGCMQ